ncbi:uncharacterized protein RAG0_09721 [Rhynchosporium agropyri]|uniref:Uncharacterized protein n=1 Tax=Rhynchosporium agropyri TaxID=914238 RepID=A0A1E1KWV7_9HELO|nr:uncharacterized protein RAG0_09721 [Rhynchosporium agropyri]
MDSVQHCHTEFSTVAFSQFQYSQGRSEKRKSKDGWSAGVFGTRNISAGVIIHGLTLTLGKLLGVRLSREYTPYRPLHLASYELQGHATAWKVSSIVADK